MTQVPGEHLPPVKNRSSKQWMCLTKRNPIVRCVSNAVLEAWSKGNTPGVHAEIKRRAAKGRGKTK